MPRIDNSKEHDLVKIDVKDEKILDIMSENSRAPLSEVAKKIAQSRDTTNYRVNRLKSLGVIEQFNPRINFLKLGYNTYHVFLLADEAKDYDKLVEALCNHENTVTVLEYTDTWDIEVIMIARNIRELDRLIDEIQSKYADTIMERRELLEINTFRSILFSHHFDKEVKRMNLSREIEEVDEYKVDKHDIKILKALSDDSRKSTYEIAKDVSLNADTIGLRIKKMIAEKLIVKFTIVPNFSTLGYNWYTVTINMRKFGEEDQKRFRNFVENREGIIRSAKTFGEDDVILYIVTKSQREFHQIVKNIRTEFSELIKSYETLVSYKEHVYNPFPRVLEKLGKE